MFTAMKNFRLRRTAGMIVIALMAWAAAPIARGQEVARIAAKFDSDINESKRLYDLTRYDEAITAAKAALALDPKSAVAHNNLAVSYAGLGQWDEAMNNARAAFHLQPGFDLAINNLAWFLRAKGAPASIADAQRTAAAWLDLSLGYYQAHRYPESIDAGREALKLQPDLAAAHNNIGAAYGNLQMWDDAIPALREALRLQPDFQLARNNLAWVEAGKANAGAAVK
jgi:protein O-mannosyl-transferase